MADHEEKNVTLSTLHQDLQAGFVDLKATLVLGFRNMPSREGQEEMVRLLREGNRLQEERFAQLDARIREQHIEVQQALRAMAEGIGNLAGAVGTLANEVRTLTGEVRTISSDIKALIARIDALIRGREDGNPTS